MKQILQEHFIAFLKWKYCYENGVETTEDFTPIVKAYIDDLQLEINSKEITGKELFDICKEIDNKSIREIKIEGVISVPEGETYGQFCDKFVNWLDLWGYSFAGMTNEYYTLPPRP